MNLTYLIPIILAVLVSVVFLLPKKKYSIGKFQSAMQIVGLICCVFAMIAIFASYYYSGDKTQLYKLALPGTIMLLSIGQIKRNKMSK